MRTALVLIALVMASLLAPVVSAQEVQVVQAEPAWCGGSWQPTSLQETIDDKGNVMLVPVAGTGGTNYGACVPVVRAVKRMAGNTEKEEMVSIPTYPAHPAALVTFQPDPKTGELVGGRIVTSKDPKTGDDVSRWEPIAPLVIKAQR